MLLPRVGHPLFSTPGQSGSGQSPRQAPGPAPVTSAPSSSGGDVLDIAEEVALLMEQDLDYQILRKAFSLDESRVTETLHRREGRADAAGQLDLSGDVRSGARHAGLAQGVVEGASFNLEVDWSQMSASSIEFSARSQDASLALQVSGVARERLDLDLRLDASSGVQLGDPLILDLGGQGVRTTGVDAGVLFDLDGDGRLDQTSSVRADSWFLALDWNENGRIDDGRELFGDQNGAANGFEELARYDSNQDGRIDAGDDVYAQLRLLQINGDGEQSTQSLGEAKVVSIELGYQNTRKALDLYDQVAQTAHFTREDGSRGEAADVLLGHKHLA
ncbi:hypothetical protein [Thiocystis violacea]|uniref:hypothetical protein n=1 Tax=Thiocystis violacea TaxID=13725 RepID=UPI001905CFBE|nr:hypothetical protein [Thiocystis violacea]